MSNYNWATLGCGVIANELALAMEKRGQKLYSVANRTKSKAVAFAEKYGIKKVYIPSKNKNDVKEIPKEVKCNLEIILVSNYLEIYKDIFN